MPRTAKNKSRAVKQSAEVEQSWCHKLPPRFGAIAPGNKQGPQEPRGSRDTSEPPRAHKQDAGTPGAPTQHVSELQPQSQRVLPNSSALPTPWPGFGARTASCSSSCHMPALAACGAPGALLDARRAASGKPVLTRRLQEPQGVELGLRRELCVDGFSHKKRGNSRNALSLSTEHPSLSQQLQLPATLTSYSKRAATQPAQNLASQVRKGPGGFSSPPGNAKLGLLWLPKQLLHSQSQSQRPGHTSAPGQTGAGGVGFLSRAERVHCFCSLMIVEHTHGRQRR